MIIKEVVSILQKEKLNNLPSRFPCRAIMVNTVEQYCQLLSELKKISDIRVIKTNEIFSSADVLPKYSNLSAATYRDEWVILTGVREDLLLCGAVRSQQVAADGSLFLCGDAKLNGLILPLT